MTGVEAAHKIGVSEQTHYSWRKEYGGIQVEQAKLRRIVSHSCEALSVSERLVCTVVGAARNSRCSMGGTGTDVLLH